MNEKPVEAMQEPSDPTECHSTPSQDEEAIPAEIPPHQATKRGENCEELFEEAIEDPSLSENSDQDSDPDRESSEQDSSRELERLRGELKNLQDQLALKDARLGQISAEFEEFNTLYPNTPLSSLGDRVWADVQRGIPVAAAYALEKRRMEHTAQTAAISNAQNTFRSSGALGQTQSDYFSPAEVRAMSPSEVRANYQKIIQSMQKWR